MTSSEEVIRRLVGQISRTQDVELGCRDVYAVLDQYAEAVAGGADAATLLPMVKQHLDLCSDCCEEYEALLSILLAGL